MKNLVVIGGAEDKTGECKILKEFVDLCGGKQARIAVMTAATSMPKKHGREYTRVLKRLGAGKVTVVDIADRAHANQEEYMKPIDTATGIFFTGGDQFQITTLIGGTLMDTRIHKRFEAGVVLGGTSAGAAMMPNAMIITGETNSTPRFGCVELGPGMEFISGVITDTHFSKRGRFGRLLLAIAHYPHDLGIGIDEDTAIIIQDSKFRVVGSGIVTVIDAGDVTYSNLPELKHGDNLALYRIKVHILPEGHEFHLRERRPIEENKPMKRVVA